MNDDGVYDADADAVGMLASLFCITYHLYMLPQPVTMLSCSLHRLCEMANNCFIASWKQTPSRAKLWRPRCARQRPGKASLLFSGRSCHLGVCPLAVRRLNEEADRSALVNRLRVRT